MADVYVCMRCGRFTEEPVHCGVPARPLLSGERRVRLSKLMSGILRHFPHSVGLKMGEDGFVPIDDLVEAIRGIGYGWVTKEHVLAVAELDPKGRFEVRGGLIRARYGHSVPVRIEYELVGPTLLYHGTTTSRVPRILREGLKPGRRMVHLTSRLEDAWANGARWGEEPVVLVVDAASMVRRGYRFYRAAPTVYLTPYVPPRYIVRVMRRKG